MKSNTPTHQKQIYPSPQNANDDFGFTSAEAAAVREVLSIHAMFKSWGKLGRGLLWLLMAFGGAVVAWEAIITRVGK